MENRGIDFSHSGLDVEELHRPIVSNALRLPSRCRLVGSGRKYG
jgi:hypothetical protein